MKQDCCLAVMMGRRATQQWRSKGWLDMLKGQENPLRNAAARTILGSGISQESKDQAGKLQGMPALSTAPRRRKVRHRSNPAFGRSLQNFGMHLPVEVQAQAGAYCLRSGADLPEALSYPGKIACMSPKRTV